MESAASGLLAGVNAARFLQGREALTLPRETMLGSLAHYVATADPKHFQPMNANFGILPPFPERIRDKQARKVAYVDRATKSLETYLSAVEEN